MISIEFYGQSTKCRRKIAENFNRLSTRTNVTDRQTTDRQTDGRQQIANVNMSSRSLKTIYLAHHIYVCHVRIMFLRHGTSANKSLPF